MAGWEKKKKKFHLEEMSNGISEFRYFQLQLQIESLKILYKKKAVSNQS